MEWRKVAGKPSDLCILNFLIVLLSSTLASSGEAEENSGSGRPVWNIERSTDDPSVWSGDSLEVKVGSNLTLSCMIDALDLQYDVFRISLIQGDVLFPLVENGLVHSPFSNINRYSVTMNEDGGNGGARMTIHIEDIQPEDTGTYICNKHMETDNLAVLNVSVLAPILDLYITSIDPDGEEMRMDAESEVFLQEHDFYGVGCVATHEGSQTPPQLRVEIDGKDETESFQVIHEVDASILPSGLTLWTSHLRLALVSASPNPDYNEKLMRCVAAQTGHPDVEATTRLLVQFAPLIKCVPERLVAQQGTSATLDCNIRANPGSRITWSSARGDLSNYPNVFFDETVISSDETRLRLSIRNIRPINFQRYTLTAANIISSSQSTFELVEDETVVVKTRPEVGSFPPDDPSILSEMVEEVFPDGYNDFPAIDVERFEETSLAPESSSISPEASSAFLETSSAPMEATSAFPETSSTLLEASSSSQEEDIRTVVPVIGTSSDVKSTLEVGDGLYPNATLPAIKNSFLADVKNTFQNVDSTLPLAQSTSPDVKSTLPPVKSTLPPVKRTLTPVRTSSPNMITTGIEVGFDLPHPTTVTPSQRSRSPSGKPHSSPGGRARSAHHKGTSIPLKASRDALSATAAADAAPTKEAPRLGVPSSDEEQLEQPLPAAAGEVHYSLSRSSSSSSSSKKDSGKSGKANTPTSGAAPIAVVQYLLASLLPLILRWF